jgi:hypothetical protein
MATKVFGFAVGLVFPANVSKAGSPIVAIVEAKNRRRFVVFIYDVSLEVKFDFRINI